MLKAMSPLRAWVALLALSVVIGVLADLRSGARLGAALIAGISGLVLLKAYVILAHYMGLEAHSGVLAAFMGSLALVLVVVCAAFVLV